MRPSHLWAAAAVALGVTLAGCSGGSTDPTAGSQSTTTTASAGGSGSSGTSPLAQAVAYSQCMRSHGVPNFPDPASAAPAAATGTGPPELTRTPLRSKRALQACKGLPSPWNSTGQQLTAAQQQAWLNWAECIRAHGVANFPDPTFSGSEVHDSGVGSNSSQLQSAMEPARRRPSVAWAGDRNGRQRLSSSSPPLTAQHSAAWAAGPVTRKTWVLAGAAVLVAVGRHRRRGRTVRCEASDLGRNRAAGEHREGGKEDTLGHGLGGRGPDLSGAIGRFSVLGDQPGQRDIHRAARLGQVISQGQVLYRVNDSPVVLLYGSTPAYRTLSAGATGADVAELNADLVALGYATSAQLSPTSASFGSATTTALEKLQAALGVTQNGTLTLGQAVFEPTAVRVTTLSAPLGGSAQTGQTVMQATSTTRQVQVALDASQQTDVAVGDKVTITLPNNQTTPGVVSSVGTVATCPSSSGSGGSSSGSAAQGTDTCSSGSSGAAPHRPSPWTSPPPILPPRAPGIRPRCRSPSPPPACPAPWWYR